MRPLERIIDWMIKFWYIVVIIILLLLLLFFGFIRCPKQMAIKTTEVRMAWSNDSLAMAETITALEISIADLKTANSELTIALKECEESKLPKVTVKKASVPAAKQTVKKVTAPALKPVAAPTPATKPAPTPQTVAAPVLAPEVKTPEVIIRYKPLFKGESGATIDGQYLTFYLTDSLFRACEPTIEKPRLDTDKGQVFTLEGKYWVYRTIMVAQPGGSKCWCVYIGQDKEFNYKMFIPHEWVLEGGKTVRLRVQEGTIRPNGHKEADGVTEGYEFVSVIAADRIIE